MIIKQPSRYVFIISILDSLLLAYIYLEAFLTENFDASLITNFTLPFYTIPLIFLVLYLIVNVKHKSSTTKGVVPLPVKYVMMSFFYIIVLVFIYGLVMLLYTMLKGDTNTLLKTTAYVVVEIVAIVFVIENNSKTKRVGKLVFLFLLWSFAIMGAYSVLGFCDEYLHYKFDNNLKLIFTGIFFHLGNAGFVVYLNVTDT